MPRPRAPARLLGKRGFRVKFPDFCSTLDYEQVLMNITVLFLKNCILWVKSMDPGHLEDSN